MCFDELTNALSICVMREGEGLKIYKKWWHVEAAKSELISKLSE